MKNIKRFKSKCSAAYDKIKAAVSQLCKDECGEMYIGEVIKIIIAIVLGLLLLGALTHLFVTVILPLIQSKITGMFGTP